MFDIYRLRVSIVNNSYLWMSIWVLFMLNIALITFVYRGFEWTYFFLTILLVIAGLMIIKFIASLPLVTEQEIIEEVEVNVNDLMEQIKPICEDIFNRKVDNYMQLFLTNLQKEIIKGSEWLWQDYINFLQKVNEKSNGIRTTIQLVYSYNDERTKILESIENNNAYVIRLVNEVFSSREKAVNSIDRYLHKKSTELKQILEKEKEIFYGYVNELLIEQLNTQEEGLELIEYINIYTLGDQFNSIIEQSIESRMQEFENTINQEMEDHSADMVGQMQMTTSKLSSVFIDLEEDITTLLDMCKNESNLLIKRLEEKITDITELKDESSGLLVTIAWQDILLEKRWQDILEKIYKVKKMVFENLSPDVTEHIENYIIREIPVLYDLKTVPESILHYKLVVDTEVIYQIYNNNKLSNVITNDAYILLNYVNVVESLVKKAVSINDIGISKIREIRENVKNSAYTECFDNIVNKIENKNPDLLTYLQNCHPSNFYTFCNIPYINEKPEDINTAAWMLFLGVIQKENVDEGLYELIGLLLIIHSLRNLYIHPFKSEPIPVNDNEKIELMRSCFKDAVSLILSLKLKGMVKLNY
ncbi:hypothetical protein SYNTR_1602 [Candidatus Syntrophocurvum alkaliphilum]|uniref:Uncharacterized protein n=1 Tax=Candidatus Syntrophocurvum alkaliphilum TaxID=2293317 RepID=A0A6I6DC65_9FIRM|nr:hypothetical protein [Candidatus Syntrophocurvum alkaliphilum]QGU00196.1 hypothetical protein SYNTR_1602 [Candidatus Syntrophocurvum alkaliphilum]